ncbi:MAG: beta-eliminating lyase-related protein [Eubacteriales bacterium]|nr:beta-eliminating lyase-related protein [Eubacteriales bacterium]
MEKIMLASDYQEGAHPAIIKRLCDTNLLSTEGYGTDDFSESGRVKIRKACECPDAAIHFLVGGTQTNATVIDALLRSYEGVIAADSGHISVHEAGAIEAGGHKVLPLCNDYGKIDAVQLRDYYETWLNDGNRDHMVKPGMVYLSQPTEYGTLYSLKELTSISNVCRKYHLPLYVDGARLAYALACPENDVTLPDLARLCDVFYIGGTKCGALMGEAVVIPDPTLIPHFFTIIKQHGALLAKGRLLGLQFDTLFTDDLYEQIGSVAIRSANRLRDLFKSKGYTLSFASPTNQIFLTVDDKQKEHLDSFSVSSFWEKADDGRTIIRFATSWATSEEKIKAFEKCL